MKEWDLLNRIKEAYRNILGTGLTGIYVHGSVAFGCFHWERSDIDFLVVAEQPLKQYQKEQLIAVLLDLDRFAPAKGFEMSVVLRSACSPFSDPMPFELHYSNAYRENYQRDLAGTCQSLQGYDADLAAHITVVRSAGITLDGESIETVFAPVPLQSYCESIWSDIQSAPEAIYQNPVYYVLNLCRVLATVQEGLVLSKEQGGEWGSKNIPEDRDLINAALTAYRQGVPVPAGETLGLFARKMLERIRQNAVFLGAANKKD